MSETQEQRERQEASPAAETADVGTWRAHDIDGRGFYMESPLRSVHLSHAHCKACAYVEVLQKFGGDVDLRGLHRYGKCYGFLQFVVRQVRTGEVDSSNEEITAAEGKQS